MRGQSGSQGGPHFDFSQGRWAVRAEGLSGSQALSSLQPFWLPAFSASKLARGPVPKAASASGMSQDAEADETAPAVSRCSTADLRSKLRRVSAASAASAASASAASASAAVEAKTEQEHDDPSSGAGRGRNPRVAFKRKRAEQCSPPSGAKNPRIAGRSRSASPEPRRVKEEQRDSRGSTSRLDLATMMNSTPTRRPTARRRRA